MKKIAPLLALLACASLSAAQAQNVRQVPLTTNDIIYDSHTAKIYASVPSSAGAGGNSITPINPVAGTVGTPVFVGSEPNKLAVSDDGQFLYVGLDGAAAVRRVSLPTQTAGLQFSLGSDPFSGPYYVEDMQVLPGNAHALAVSEKNLGVSPANAGVAVFDDGVQRAQRLARGANEYDSLAFSSDPSILYTYDNEDTGYGFCRLGVDASGLTLLSTAGGVITGFRQTISYDGGSVYASDGQVIDPATQALLGNFSGTGAGASVRPDVADGRVFFLSNDDGQNSTATIQAYDSATFLPTGTLKIPGVVGAVGGLIAYGANGLAFRTSGGQVFLVDSRGLPGLASFSLSASHVASGGTATGTVMLTQPAPAGGVTVTLSSSNRLAAAVPASVTVPAGASSATFNATGRSLTRSFSVFITAAYGAQRSQVKLVVQDAADDPDYPANIRVLAVAPNASIYGFPSNDPVYNRVNGDFYFGSPSGAVGAGNSIVTLDPRAATFGTPVFVGSEPNNLALSDDGTALYVGLDGAAAVRRFDTAAQLPGLQFSLGRDSFLGPYYVQQILTVPGTTDSVAVAEMHLDLSPANDGVSIFDNGIPRPMVVRRGRYEYDSLAFSSDPTKLYAYDNEDTGYGFSRLGVSAGGVSVLSGAGDLLSGFGVTIKYDGGWAYASTGAVVDPEVQSLLGSFSGVGAGASVRPDAADGRVFFLSNDDGQSGTATIQAYDTATFLPTGTLTIPNVIGAVGDLFRWGADGLAFRTGGGQIFLIRTSLIPNAQPAPASVALAPSQVIGGEATTGTVTLAAAAPAGGVTVWLSSSDPDVASTPASLTVAAGRTSATFPVTTRTLMTQTAITVSAVSGGVPASAPLTVHAPSHDFILWTNPDGRAVLWDSHPGGTYGDHGQYGPYTDGGGTWHAVALATGPDGVSHLLWVNPDGRAVLWYVKPDGTHGDGGQFGPYTDAGGTWKALTVSVGPDSLPHLLWTNPDGREVVWDGHADGTYTNHGQYGPYTDAGGVWRATSLSVGLDALPHLLWTNPDGREVLWDGHADGTYSDHGQYGPYTDAGGVWRATAVAVGPDALSHLLWVNPDGRSVVWDGHADGTYTDHGQYGPYTDAGGTWAAVTALVGPDSLAHLLWASPDGRAVLWNGNGDGTYSNRGQYGPYTDSGGTWRAVAASAGP